MSISVDSISIKEATQNKEATQKVSKEAASEAIKESLDESIDKAIDRTIGESINEQISSLLTQRGADLIGFADLTGVENAMYEKGISVAVKLPADVVRGIADGPTLEYYEQYHKLNALLDEIVTAGAQFIESLGYKAYAQASKTISFSKENGFRTPLPHKTVAARAGLGWIGRCALLITTQYGSAVRISSIVTDAPIVAGQSATESKCSDYCEMCRKHCPAGAVKGAKWKPGSERETMFDAYACCESASKRLFENTGKTGTICGKCIEVCPYTRAYTHKKPSK